MRSCAIRATRAERDRETAGDEAITRLLFSFFRQIERIAGLRSSVRRERVTFSVNNSGQFTLRLVSARPGRYIENPLY